MRFLPALVVVLMLPVTVVAHAIGLEARLKAGTVLVEAFYDDGTPATASKVVVLDEAGRLLAEGETDSRGFWNFPAPAAGKYRIRVDAGAGHVARRTITIPTPASAEGNGVMIPQSRSSSESPIISDGPNREEFTGPTRWVMAGVGIAFVGIAALLLRWLTRTVRGRRAKV